MSIGLLIVQYLKANAVSGALALAAWMLIDTIYVFLGSGNRWFLEVSGPVIVFLAIVAFLSANWRLTSGSVFRRSIKAVLLALPMIAVWLVVGAITLLWFHPLVGGKE